MSDNSHHKLEATTVWHIGHGTLVSLPEFLGARFAKSSHRIFECSISQHHEQNEVHEPMSRARLCASVLSETDGWAREGELILCGLK